MLELKKKIDFNNSLFYIRMKCQILQMIEESYVADGIQFDQYVLKV